MIKSLILKVQSEFEKGLEFATPIVLTFLLAIYGCARYLTESSILFPSDLANACWTDASAYLNYSMLKYSVTIEMTVLVLLCFVLLWTRAPSISSSLTVVLLAGIISISGNPILVQETGTLTGAISSNCKEVYSSKDYPYIKIINNLPLGYVLTAPYVLYNRDVVISKIKSKG